ncbi:MAG: YceI family protein [Myxococcales bacterium]|nr:YceI family protein [Myxococcales bacterium]
MNRRRNQWVLVLSVVSALAYFSSADASVVSHTLEEGKVHFVCEGPEVTVPAWGQFGTVEGALSIDPSDLRTVSGNIDVFMVSIRTNDSAWDTMFRRAGFLEIDDLPKSRFVLEAVRGAKTLEPGKWVPMTLEGRFALHGIRRKISVPATVRWSPADRKAGTSERIHVRASFHVTWDDYEIAMPTGRTRTFAGDGAIIQADLAYRPIEGKRR